MNRLSVVLFSVLLAISSSATATPPPADKPARQPNLLFILTDEQRHDTLAAYGNRAIKTPHLNRLADESVVFRRAYVSQPVCSPARSTILTGLWPHQSGVTANNIPLKKTTRTLPELVNDRAYRSAFMGKWHLGAELSAQHGFDEWVAIEDGYTLEDPRTSAYHHWLIDKGYAPDTRHQTFSRGESNKLPLEHSKTAFLQEKAVEFLEKNKARPFMLYLSYLQPHTPNFGPLDSLHSPEDVNLAPSVNQPLGENDPLRYRLLSQIREAFTDAEWKVEMAKYWGLVSQVDRSVGEVIAKLKELGLYDNTIIVLTSEHGKQMGEHGLWGKGVLYEASARVPWLIKAPGVKRRVVEPPMSHIDLVPTLLDLMGKPRAASLPGRSLVPLMRGETLETQDVYIEWNPNGQRGAFHTIATVSKEEFARMLNERSRTIVTRDGWKLCLSDVDKSFLFDLNTDPHETTNLYSTGQNERQIETLSKRIFAWQRAVGDPLNLPQQGD